ncbi:MAG: mannitol dehydrogenase family protein [Roseobacter sp.]
MNVGSSLARSRIVAKPGIVHLGPGAFFRAFGAVYTDEVLRAAGGDWGIIAVSLQSDRAKRELAPQDHVYTAVEMGPKGEAFQVVEAISDVLVAREDPQQVLAAMADPAIKIVSLTITEKGYCRDAGTGALRREDADIQHDLADLQKPKTALGFIVSALKTRRAKGLRPFTVLSCDNLPDNGATARAVILEFATACDPGLAEWIAEHGRFPATMVDRITPATTAQDIARLAEKRGYRDLACVYHEPFRQWVIEDQFVDDARPDWDMVGAQFVASVQAHEAMKLRCLNGTHSALAYLGYLAGHETIAGAVADPDFAALCRKLWRTEILPTLTPPEGEDLAAYVVSLMARYANPAIQHRTWQIAMDGSQKLPQRFLGTIADNLASGRSVDGLCLAVAGWMRYVGGMDEQGAAIDVRDPMADQLKAASDAGRTDAEKVDALMALRAVFPDNLVSNAVFRSDVLTAYETLRTQGAARTVAAYVGGSA